MSPAYFIDFEEMKVHAMRHERKYRAFERELENLRIRHTGKRANERLLVSRNMREGRYMERIKK